MKKILITGGAGFIGSHLVDAYVADGFNVTVLDNLSTGHMKNVNPAAHFVQGDIRDKSLVTQLMEQVDGCVHLAAVASVEKSCEDWSDTHAVNLTGTINVFEASFKKLTPVVYASSAAIYGLPNRTPLDETDPISPISPYGADKAACEMHAHCAWNVKNLPSRGMRFFNVYGPRQDPKSPYSGVISIFADRMLNEKEITINGDGKQTRDFIYVSDVVAAITSALKNCTSGSEVFAVCTGTAVTITELANELARLTGYQKELIFGPARNGDIQDSLGNPSKMNQKLGTPARVSLTQGLSKTLESLATVDNKN